MRIRCALVAVLAAACGGKEDPGPTCEQLTDHLLGVMNGSVPAHGGMEMANKQLMVQRCDEKHYDAKTRTCMLAATTMVAAGACSGEKPTIKPHGPKHLDLIPGGSGSGSGSQ